MTERVETRSADKQLEPANVRGCRGLDDVKGVAYDKSKTLA